MLKELTMFIPTFKRQHMIPCIIKYYNKSNIRIIIADASSKPLSIPCQLKSSNLIYLHMPDATHAERYRRALELTESEFFVPRADRRHQALSGLFQCVKFLKENKSFDAATGIWLSENLKPYYAIDILSSTGEIEDPYARLINHSLSYQPSYYAVQRIDKALKVGNIINNLYSITDNPYVVEYLTSFYFYLSGKTKQLHSLHGIIQNMNKVDNYSHMWPQTPVYLSNEKFLRIAFSYIKREIDTNIINLNKAWAAFLEASNYFIKWFYLSGVSTHSSLVKKTAKVPRFTLLEDLYKIFYANDSSFSKTHEYLLKIFMGIFFERDVNFSDIKHLFSESDMCEIQSILNMIDECRKAENS